MQQGLIVYFIEHWFYLTLMVLSTAQKNCVKEFQIPNIDKRCVRVVGYRAPNKSSHIPCHRLLYSSGVDESLLWLKGNLKNRFRPRIYTKPSVAQPRRIHRLCSRVRSCCKNSKIIRELGSSCMPLLLRKQTLLSMFVEWLSFSLRMVL